MKTLSLSDISNLPCPAQPELYNSGFQQCNNDLFPLVILESKTCCQVYSWLIFNFRHLVKSFPLFLLDFSCKMLEFKSVESKRSFPRKKPQITTTYDRKKKHCH